MVPILPARGSESKTKMEPGPEAQAAILPWGPSETRIRNPWQKRCKLLPINYLRRGRGWGAAGIDRQAADILLLVGAKFF
jgi:hypothetical protein